MKSYKYAYLLMYAEKTIALVEIVKVCFMHLYVLLYNTIMYLHCVMIDARALRISTD